MKSRLILALILTSFVTHMAIGQIRDYIGIVRPNVSQYGVDAYEAIASFFDQIEEEELAEYFRNMASGGHGSGFLCSVDGALVFVTNRHVVSFADSAVIEIRREDGTTRTFDDLPVEYIDDEYDVAVIPLRSADADDLTGLVVDIAPPIDGGDVWAAGYPGLFSQPLWQLTKGTVTNRRILADELDIGIAGTYIQHSASIDPGSSGGPLLSGDITDPSSLRVIGMNTWYAANRQNVFFAATGEDILAALKRYGNQHAADDEGLETADLQAKVEEFVAELNESSWDRLSAPRFISYRLAAEYGWPIFRDDIRIMPTEDRGRWIDRFFGRSPLETLREYVGWIVWDEIHIADAESVVGAVDAGPDNISRNVTIVCGERSIPTLWRLEYGNWYLASLPDALVPVEDDLGNGAEFRESSSSPFAIARFGFSFGFGATTSERASEFGLTVGAEAILKNNLLVGIDVIAVNLVDVSDIGSHSSDTTMYDYIGPSVGIQADLLRNFFPLRFTARAGFGPLLTLNDAPGVAGFAAIAAANAGIMFGPILEFGLFGFLLHTFDTTVTTPVVLGFYAKYFF